MPFMKSIRIPSVEDNSRRMATWALILATSACSDANQSAVSGPTASASVPPPSPSTASTVGNVSHSGGFHTPFPEPPGSATGTAPSTSPIDVSPREPTPGIAPTTSTVPDTTVTTEPTSSEEGVSTPAETVTSTDDGISSSGSIPDVTTLPAELPPPVPGSPAPRHGERYPFPQNAGYPYGTSSERISAEHVRAWYDSWSVKYLQQCDDSLRPGVDPLSRSLVEAQGFAMVAAAYMGDKPTFDRLYAFYERKLTAYGCGLMGWDNTCEGFTDQGAATDGDIDVASGLIVAHWQWPNDGYDARARAVISNLRRMIVDCNGTYALYPGCAFEAPWGGCDETDASYYSPAFFRYFAQFSGDEAWVKLADDSHVVRDAAAHPVTGLVPDWQSVAGRPGAGERKDFYSFDAIRTPYKHGLDYLFHGNTAARDWCIKLTSWAHENIGAENLVDGYELDGTPVGEHHNLAVVGAMAVCSLANTRQIADAFVAESVRMRDDFWYSAYLGNLYLLAMSGNMWTPDTLRRSAQ